MIWPIGSRTIQRFRLAVTSLDSTGSPSWNFSPVRSLNVQVRPSLEASCPSTICGFGSSLLSTPYSVSQISSAALRTTYCVPATESSDDRFAWGMNRSTRLSWARTIRGAASVPAVTAAVVRKSRRFISPTVLIRAPPYAWQA